MPIPIRDPADNRIVVQIHRQHAGTSNCETDLLDRSDSTFLRLFRRERPQFDEGTRRNYKEVRQRSFFSRFQVCNLTLTSFYRRMLATGITRIIGSYLSSSIKPLGPSAPARPSLAMMHRVDLLVPGSMDSMWRLLHPQNPQPEYNAWVAVVEEKTRTGVAVSFFIPLSSAKSYSLNPVVAAFPNCIKSTRRRRSTAFPCSSKLASDPTIRSFSHFSRPS